MKLIFWCSLAVVFGFTISAQAKSERSVSVRGECLRNLIPNRGSVTLTAEATEPTPGVATQKTMDLYAKIKDHVKKMNLKDLELETTELSVNQDFDYSGKVRRSRGYRSRIGLRIITSETARLSLLASLAGELRVQDVSGLTSFVSRESLREARESCLEEAFKFARSKAEKLAGAANAKLGQIEVIREDGNGSEPSPVMPIARMMEMRGDIASKSASPEIETGTVKLEMNIWAQFELL